MFTAPRLVAQRRRHNCLHCRMCIQRGWNHYLSRRKQRDEHEQFHHLTADADCLTKITLTCTLIKVPTYARDAVEDLAVATALPGTQTLTFGGQNLVNDSTMPWIKVTAAACDATSGTGDAEPGMHGQLVYTSSVTGTLAVTPICHIGACGLQRVLQQQLDGESGTYTLLTSGAAASVLKTSVCKITATAMMQIAQVNVTLAIENLLLRPLPLRAT